MRRNLRLSRNGLPVNIAGNVPQFAAKGIYATKGVD